MWAPLLCALPALTQPVLVEPPLPADWTRIARRDADDLIADVRITLQQRNMDVVKRRAVDASAGGTGAAFYGRGELDELTAPHAEHVAAATTWLEQHGVGYSRRGAVLTLEPATAHTIEALFNTELHTIRSIRGEIVFLLHAR